MNTKIARKLCVGTALPVLALALGAMPAFAQVTSNANTAAADDQGKDERDIVVTGTLIRNPNLTSSTPVNVVSEAEITRRVPATTEELIRALPGVSPGVGTQVNNGSNGTNNVDLRGLGVQRNLVLLDGNRLVPSLANGAVDLNVIPLALISRVDLLTGGASTTYGADAVSGVVNFITRKDFTGLDLRAVNKITEQGDGYTFRGDLTVGANFADGRGNAVLSFGYSEIKPVYQTRPFALFGISSSTGRASGASFTSVPTTISFPGADLQVSQDSSTLVPQYQGFNFNPYNIFQTPLNRKSLYAATTYQVADNIEFYGRGLFSQTTIQSIIAPSGIFGNPLTIPGNNPYLNANIRDQICTRNGIALGATCNTNPALALPAVYRRLVELGPRLGTYQNNLYDANAGFRIDLGKKLNLDFGGSFGRSEQTLTQSGYVLTARVQQALNATNTTTCNDTSGGCVPLNLFGPAGSISPAQAAFLQGQSSTRINTELGQLRALLTGEIGTLGTASKAVNFAVGAEYRNYFYQRIPDAFAQDPSALGGAGGAITPFTGGYDVKEAYGEIIAPIFNDQPFAHSLTLEAGVRYSAYNVRAAGNPSFDATTYKGGLNWEPVRDLRIRATYQRAVRAPNIAELFTPTSTNLTNLATEPCVGAAPTTNANLRNICLAQGAPAASIGAIQAPSAGQANATFVYSPAIRPETADTFTVGFVFTPTKLVPNLSISVDYYDIKINRAITFQTPDDAINACFGNITAASAASAACTSIRRNPANGRLSGPAATTGGLLLLESNNGRLITNGIDWTVNWNHKFGEIGLDLSWVGNWTNTLKFRASPTSLNRECAGYYSANCGVSLGQIQPELSWLQRTTLSVGGVSGSLLWRHISPARYEPGLPALYSGVITNAAGASSALAGQSFNFNRIPAYDYLDLSFAFDIAKNYTLVIASQNLTNLQPPVVGGQAGTTTANSGNTFPSTYDPLGRSFSATIRVKF